MSIILRQEQINEKWFAWVAYDGLNCIMLEDNHEMTEEEAAQKLLDWQSSQIVIEELPDGPTE
jgi:hypothetical protein